jgi:hypothetical protein
VGALRCCLWPAMDGDRGDPTMNRTSSRTRHCSTSPHPFLFFKEFWGFVWFFFQLFLVYPCQIKHEIIGQKMIFMLENWILDWSCRCGVVVQNL